jgi:protein MpaA
MPINRRRHGRWMMAAAALPVVLAGCAARQASDRPSPPVSDPLQPQAIIIGDSVQGRPIVCESFGDGGDVILIMASIHGNEPAGTPLLQRLAEELASRVDLLRGRRVLLVPIANPDGYAGHTRGNAHGVDVNRNFAAGNWRTRRANGPAPLSEPESRAIERLIIAERPARIVSIHQPLACVDYDGPAADLARIMADATGLPVRKLGGRPGSLGSWAGLDCGIPIITLELPRSAGRLDREELWRRYGPALIAAIAYRE